MQTQTQAQRNDSSRFASLFSEFDRAVDSRLQKQGDDYADRVMRQVRSRSRVAVGVDAGEEI